jgi:hypothetical protein
MTHVCIYTHTPDDLTELMHAMKTARTGDAFSELGLPVRHGEPDWTSLPTFGGEIPDNTVEVWSWDADEMLVGTCPDDLQLVPRLHAI